MKVWVVYADQGYGGYSIPFKAFSNEEAARKYRGEANDSDKDWCDWKELEAED